MCGSTVAVLYCPPPPSWAVLYGVRQEGGRGSVCGSGGCKNPPGLRSTLAPPKTIVIIKWGRGMVVPLPPSRNSIVHYTLACNRPPPQTEKKPNKNTTDRHHTSERRRRMKKKKKKKKKQVRERCLGVYAEHEVRVEGGVLGQEEETQGETQTPNGVWVSPAPEREKDREKNVADE